MRLQKLKRHWWRQSSVALGIILSAMTMVTLLGAGHAAADPATSAPIVANSTAACVPTIQEGDAEPAFSPVVARNDHSIWINGQLPLYAGDVGWAAIDPAEAPYQEVDANGPPDAMKSIFKAVEKNNVKVLDITFSSSTGGDDAACQSSLAFFRDINASDKTTFYGTWVGKGILPKNGNVEAIVRATVNPADQTVTFYLHNGPSAGSNNYTVKLNNFAAVAGDFGATPGGGGGGTTGGGGGSGGVSIAQCAKPYTTNADGAFSTCIGGRTATFTDIAHISFDGQTYIAGKWGGDSIHYTLDPNSSDATLKGLSPYFDINTNVTETSYSIKGPSDGSTNYSNLQALKAAIAANKTLGVTYHIGSLSGAVPTSLSAVDIVADYYPSNNVIQIAFRNGASTNEGYFYGQYTASSSSDTTSYKLPNGGFPKCNTSSYVPEFDFAGGALQAAVQSVTHAESINGGTLSTPTAGTWKVSASNGTTCIQVSIPIRVNVYDQSVSPPSILAPETTDTTGSASISLSCGTLLNPLNWIFCPLVKAATGTVSVLDTQINSLMTVGSPGSSDDPSEIFSTSSGGFNCNAASGGSTADAYYCAWKDIRNISLGFVVIAGLFVVISQALGFEFLDAYTIRKVLPRLIIATIGLTLSWPLMQFLVTLSNDLGLGIRQLIYLPFSHTLGHTASASFTGAGGLAGASFIGGLAILDIFGLLSLVLTGFMAALIAFLVLILRQIIITALIILAPIAIVCSILPNTNNIFKLWWDSFFRGLMMFPIIAAFIASGRVFALVSSSSSGKVGQIIAFISYFAPYFLLPLTFRFAGGAIRGIGGFVNDRSRGGFDRLKKFRSNRAAKNMHAFKEGERFKGNVPGFRRLGGAANEITKGLGTGWQGRFGVGQRGHEARAMVDQVAANNMAQTDGMKAIAGYNDANRLQVYAMGDEVQGRKRLKEFLMTGGDDGKTFLSEAAANARVDMAARSAKAAVGGFSKGAAIAAYQNMARDGTAIRDTSDLARLGAIVGDGNRNNTFKYTAEAASVSRQVGRSDLAAASDPIGALAFSYSDEIYHGGHAHLGDGRTSRASLEAAAWESGAGGETAYTKFANAKGRTVRNDTREAVNIVRGHMEAVMAGRQSAYTQDQVRFAAATLVDTKNAVNQQYGRLNNRLDASAELARDNGALEQFLSMGANVAETSQVGTELGPDGKQAIGVFATGSRATTEAEVVQKMVGDRYADMTPMQRAQMEQQQQLGGEDH